MKKFNQAAALFTALITLSIPRVSFCEDLKPKPEDPAPTKTTEAAELVKHGRELFGKEQYAESMREFEKALLKTPSDKETRFLAGLAAYWAKMPEKALSYWNQIQDQTSRGGNEEWAILSSRIMALSAAGNIDAAELAIERLREIRESGKSSSARTVKGFVREHFFMKDRRAGCWEIFDERGESPQLWIINIARVDEKAAQSTPQKQKRPEAAEVISTLTVEAAQLPGGGAGFVFAEETKEFRRVYKHWPERPAYPEVRELALRVLKGAAKPLEEKALPPANETGAADAGIKPPVPLDIKGMGLDPQVEAIVFAAWRLRGVKADLAKLVHMGDNAAQEEYIREINAKYKSAANDASELTELVTNAKAPHLQTACDVILRIAPRGVYLEFALLTALNTRAAVNARGRDIPLAPLNEFSKSSDFIVRQMAAWILARMGEKRGLEALFKEMKTADARGCEVLMTAFEELLGKPFDGPPNSNAADAGEKLKVWKQKVAEWREANAEKLEYTDRPKAGAAYWTVK